LSVLPRRLSKRNADRRSLAGRSLRLTVHCKHLYSSPSPSSVDESERLPDRRLRILDHDQPEDRCHDQVVREEDQSVDRPYVDVHPSSPLIVVLRTWDELRGIENRIDGLTVTLAPDRVRDSSEP